MVALKRRLFRALLPTLALLAAAGSALSAQAQHALVLSGGGSRGLAHAGVLVALERLGYHSPIVIGTSMGSAIGALYAAGYSPIEIWDIVGRQNWADMFAADPFPIGPDRDPRRPMVSLGFAQGRETVLEGFVAQSAINRRLVQLLFDAGARAGNDFDSLPRRFRAIAADLRTGREVVLSSGDLPRAVRASMAVPGAFSPVRWNGQVLIDGGIANNLGISVARQLTRDPVIAVDVLRPTGDLEEGSALGIGLRAVRLLLQNARGARDSAELFVVPPIDPHFSEATFPPDASPLLVAGFEGTMRQLPMAGNAYESELPSRPAPARVDSLRIEGVYDDVAALVRRTFLPALGEYDAQRILGRVDALYATGMFHGIWPRLERTPAGNVLVVQADPVSAAVATGAAGWDNDLGPRLWAALRTRTQLVTPLELRAAASYDRISRWIAGSASFFSTIAPPWVWSGGAHWRERQIRIFDDEDIIRDPYVRRSGAWIGAEWRRLRPQQSFTFALRAEEVTAQEGPTGTSVGPYLRFGAFPAHDPTVGLENHVEAELRFGQLHYAAVHAAGSILLRSGATRFALVGALGAVSDAAPLDALPTLGGPDTAPWLRADEGRGEAVVIGGGDVAHPIARELDVRLRVRGGASAADVAELGTARWIHGIELGGVWRTAIGPVTVGVASGAEDRWRLNLSVGSRW